MNKSDLINAIAEKADVKKETAKKTLEAFLSTTKEALSKGDRISLVGFGTFSISKRNARVGRNPQTGKEINIPAKKVVKFKAGSDLNDTVQ